MLSIPPAITTRASPQPNSLRGKHDRLQPRTADFVDRGGAYRGRQTGTDRGLPGRVLAHSRTEHVAQNHLVHFLGRDTCSSQGRFDANRPKLRDRHARQRSVHRADRSSNGRKDHCLEANLN